MVFKCHRLPSCDQTWFPKLVTLRIKTSRALYLSRPQLPDFGFLCFLPECSNLAPPGKKSYSSHQLQISCRRDVRPVAHCWASHSPQQAVTQLRFPTRSITSTAATAHPCSFCKIWDTFWTNKCWGEQGLLPSPPYAFVGVSVHSILIVRVYAVKQTSLLSLE